MLLPFPHARREVYLFDSMVITPLSYNKILLEVYKDMMYLPMGPFIKSFFIVV
jgi:hypothetical protein